MNGSGRADDPTSTPADGPDETSGERHPVTSRVRARVNRPPPATKSFGNGEPTFIKVTGRSPGAPVPLVDSGRRRGIGDLPEPEIGGLAELRKRETRREALARRWRKVGFAERLLAAAVLALVVFLVFVALHR